MVQPPQPVYGPINPVQQAGDGLEDAGTPARKKEKKKRKKKKKGPPRRGKVLPSSTYGSVPNWPAAATAARLGQLSGVAIDKYGNAVVFHRGDRTWNAATFNRDNTYGGDRGVPIPMDTVLTINSTGHVVNSWGSGLFFLPHMITVDSQNNVWLTDVALHQVFKFPAYGGDHRPLIKLGEKFVPGSDDTHYCKPTAVAVSEDTNTFFVSDGYCNSRVIKYSVTVKNGKHEVNKVFEWGQGAGPFTLSLSPDSFNIPHGLALAEDRSMICVADRENGRVQCFSSDDGSFLQSVKPPGFGSRIFSVSYSPANGGKLYAVSGPDLSPFASGPTGYVIDLEGQTNSLEGTWNVPDGLKNPHDLAVSNDGSTIYVVELNPFVVWKLTDGEGGVVVTPRNPGVLDRLLSFMGLG
jgi:sugar lactone lactonase YvrE